MNGRIALSTKTLEPEPGDMIKNPQKVYDMAEVRQSSLEACIMKICCMPPHKIVEVGAEYR